MYLKRELDIDIYYIYIHIESSISKQHPVFGYFDLLSPLAFCDSFIQDTWILNGERLKTDDDDYCGDDDDYYDINIILIISVNQHQETTDDDDYYYY